MDPTRLPAWDQAGLALAHAARAPWLDSLFAIVTWLGSLAVLLPLALLVWWWRRGERSAAFVALALVGASALGHLAKLIAALSAGPLSERCRRRRAAGDLLGRAAAPSAGMAGA